MRSRYTRSLLTDMAVGVVWGIGLATLAIMAGYFFGEIVGRL